MVAHQSNWNYALSMTPGMTKNDRELFPKDSNKGFYWLVPFYFRIKWWFPPWYSLCTFRTIMYIANSQEFLLVIIY